MSDFGSQGLGDLLGLLGGTNPLAGIGRSVEQFKRGVNDFLKAVENFNDTMEQLNGVARRVNSILDEVEHVILAIVFWQHVGFVRSFILAVQRLIGSARAIVAGDHLLDRFEDFLDRRFSGLTHRLCLTP